MKYLLSLAIEITIIGSILFVLYETLFRSFGALAGGAGSWVIVFFVTIFFVDSIFYTVFRVAWDQRIKIFWKWLGIILIAIPVIVALYFVVTSTGGFKLFALPFLVPLFVLGLRYLFLKLLATKKR